MGKKPTVQTQAQPAGFAARFRLTKSQGVIAFHGPLNQGSNLALLNDLYDDNATFDLSQLGAVSWAGMLAFEKYLVDLGKAVRIIGIPRHVYNYLRLLLLDKANVTIEEAEIDTFDPRDPRRPGQPVRVKITDLEHLAVEQGPIMTLAADKQILGIAEHLCPRYFQRPRTPAPVFTNTWCLDNNDEAAFWYNFAHLSSCVLGLGLDLIETARQGIGPSSSEVKHRLKAFELAAILVDVEAPRELSAALTKELHALDANVTALHAAFAGVAAQTVVAQRQVQVACWSQTASNPDALLQPLVDLCAVAAQSAASAAAIFDVQAYRGRVAPIVANARILVDGLVGLDPLNWSAEALPQLRDLFSIMNPLSEDDWSATLEDLKAERVLVVDALNIALAHLRDVENGCHMLARWCGDSAFMQHGLSKVLAGQTTFRELRRDYFARLSSRAVQPEETYAYGFYFPDFLPKPAVGDGDEEVLSESA